MQFHDIAITGGNGLLGRFVAKRLAPRAAVTAIDLNPAADSDAAFVQADVTDYAALKAAFAGKDAVVHLAAIPNPRTTSQEKCFRTNTFSTWAVLQAAEDAGVRRVIVCSSDSATGLHYNPPGWPPQYLPVDEDHPLRPTEAYSLSKKVTEQIAKSFADRGKLEVLVIRPGHIIFEREYSEMRQRGSDLNNYHLWGHVVPEDAAQGFDLALQLDDGSFDVFFILAADGMNTRPTLDLFAERFGHAPEVRDPALYAENPTAGVFGIAHARKKLGYAPQFTWRDLEARTNAAAR